MSAINAKDSALSDPYVAAYPELADFWHASEQHRFLIRTCRGCQKAHWYPRVICPLCGSDDTTWQEAAGTGRVYSYSVIRRTDTPYVLAYIRLSEGPVMMTNIVDCDFDTLRIDQAVQVRFIQSAEGRTVPVFVPPPSPPSRPMRSSRAD